MNQEKIGKFIASKRKENKFTQLELAELLGVTDRSVSNWENGKCMPDLSLFEPLSKILNITINDLMSGEEIEDKKYKESFENNFLKVVTDIERKQKNIKRIIIISIITIISVLLMYITGIIFYNTYELDFEYNSSMMSCEIDENILKYEVKGLSVLNTHYIEKNIKGETIIFIHNTMNLYNKRRSNWEYHESMTRLLDNKSIIFKSFYEFELNKISKKISVYYTDESINKIKNSNSDEINKIIKKSYLMCTN